MKRDLRKFIIWLMSFFSEDNNKGSMKRILALILGTTCSYVIFHCVRNEPVAKWSDPIPLLITIFTFIAALLVVAYIPGVAKEKDNPPQN